MPLEYLPSPAEGELRQGEILGDVWKHETAAPATELSVTPDVVSVHHPLVVVMVTDCDLLWDHQARERQQRGEAGADEERSLLPDVLLCDLFLEQEIRARVPGSDVWRRVRQNQDERYHHIPAAPVPETSSELPDLYLDFKRTLSVPTTRLYEAIAAGSIGRKGLLPYPWVQHLTHRFYSFLARVGLPD